MRAELCRTDRRGIPADISVANLCESNKINFTIVTPAFSDGGTMVNEAFLEIALRGAHHVELDHRVELWQAVNEYLRSGRLAGLTEFIHSIITHSFPWLRKA